MYTARAHVLLSHLPIDIKSHIDRAKWPGWRNSKTTLRWKQTPSISQSRTHIFWLVPLTESPWRHCLWRPQLKSHVLPKVLVFYLSCSPFDCEIQRWTSDCLASTMQTYLAISHTYTEVDRWIYICLMYYFMCTILSALQNYSVACLPFNSQKERGKQQKGQAVFLVIIPTCYVKGSLTKFAPELWFSGTTLSSHISNTLFFQV